MIRDTELQTEKFPCFFKSHSRSLPPPRSLFSLSLSLSRTRRYEMLTGWPPFYDKNIQKMCKKILSAPLAFPFSVPLSDEAKSLISGLLQVRA